MVDFISAAVLFGLVSAISFGVADFFVGRVSQTVGSTKGALVVNTIAAVVFGIVYLLFLHGGATFNGQGVLYALIGSVFFGLAQATFFKAMSLGPVGLVSSISSTYPLVALVVGVALFAARVSFVHIVGIVLIVAGVMVASGLLSGKDSNVKLGKGPLLALLPALGWGVGLGFLTQSMTLMDWEGTFLIELIVAPLVLLLLAPFIKGDERLSPRAILGSVKLPIVWAAAILQMIGLLALNLGLSHDPSTGAVIVAVSSCYPVLTIFLALRHLNERIPLVPLLGGVAGIIGVVILAIG